MVVELSSRLDQKRFDCFVATLGESGPLTDLCSEEQVTCFVIGEQALGLSSVSKALRLLRHINVDVVYAFGLRSCLIARLARALGLVSATISAHRGDGVYESWLYTAIDRSTVALSDLIVANSFAGAETARDVLGVEAGKVQVVHSGISLDADKLDTRDIPECAREAAMGNVIVGSVANLRPEKDYDCLLQAARLVIDARSRVRFWVVGRDDLNGQVQAKCTAMGLDDHFVFWGFRSDARAVMSLLDIVTLSSVSEGLPVCILEAMSLAKPVVATDVGGVSELVISGETGYLVAPKDPASLADKIVHLIDDPEVRREMGERGAKHVQNSFSVGAMVTKTERVIELAVGSGSLSA